MAEWAAVTTPNQNFLKLFSDSFNVFYWSNDPLVSLMLLSCALSVLQGCVKFITLQLKEPGYRYCKRECSGFSIREDVDIVVKGFCCCCLFSVCVCVYVCVCVCGGAGEILQKLFLSHHEDSRIIGLAPSVFT